MSGYGEASSYQGGEAASYQGSGGHGYSQQADPYGTGNVHSSVTQYASQHTEDEDDRNLISSTLSNMMHKEDNLDTNDEEMAHAHNSRQRIYQDGEESSSPHDIGSAAAAEAMEKHRSSGESGGMNALLGMAMAEAAKLFSKQSGGGGNSAGKSEAIQQAAMMAMKMYAQKQGGSSGGSSGGTLGALMGMLGNSGGSSGGSSGMGGMVSAVLGQAMGGGGGDHKQSSGGSDMASKLIGKFL